MGDKGQHVFPKRMDHIYCLSVTQKNDGAGETEKTRVYIGRASTPGRALKHFLSHNSELAEAMEECEWTLTYQDLPKPNAEDLNIMESAVIDVVTDDQRFDAFNSLRGTAVDTPRKVDPQRHRLPKKGMLMRWERTPDVESGEYSLSKVQAVEKKTALEKSSGWWVTPSFVEKKNRGVVQEAITSLLRSADEKGPVRLPKPFFRHLPQLQEKQSPHQEATLPMAGETLSVEQLWDFLGGPFIYVQITDKTIDDDARRGVSPGLTMKRLRRRISGYWSQRSGSTTRGRTVRYLADPQLRDSLPEEVRPKWLVGAVSGQRMILCIWELTDEGTESWVDPESEKVIFPLGEAAPVELLQRTVGARIKGPLELNGKGVTWVDTR